MKKWDKYFLGIAKAVGSNSSCYSRQIGAVLVKDRSILATGYNGPARGIPSCDQRVVISPHGNVYPNGEKVCPRKRLGAKSGEMLEICPAEHAERNCIANAARHGVNTYDSKMYMDCPIPCKNCLTLLINAGVKEIICVDFILYDEISEFILAHSTIIIRNYEGERYERSRYAG